jgi:competence ComEA-like helix-hairpin-helix protein
MIRTLRSVSSRVVARVVGSRFAKPIARAAVATAGLLLLAFIGKTAVAGAMAAATPAPSPSAVLLPPSPAPAPEPAPPPAAELTLPVVQVASAGPSGTSRGSSTRASPDDPVFLNTATVEDLRRLPGIGEKRATAIMALRTRLGGRFHAVEDLLKVKGIGRTALKRLRPLVRLDPPPLPEGGTVSEGPAGPR